MRKRTSWMWLATVIAVLITFAVVLRPHEAPAQSTSPPSLEIATAPAVTPANAWTYFNGVGLSSPTRAADPVVTRTAAALGNDPTRIFTFVHDQIDVVPLFGVQKGARGCLIDKACTPFDQAHLLVELFRAAGQPANYKFGEVTLTAAQMSAWLGISNTTALNATLADGGIPYSTAVVGGVTQYTLLHLWVQATIGSTTYQLDPSFKTYTVRTGMTTTALDSAMGFSVASFMSTGSGGALFNASSSISGAPQVAAFNRNNVRANLQTYSSNLLTYIRANYANSETEDVVGGRDLVPLAGGLPSTPGYTLGIVRATFANDVPYALRTQTTVTVSGFATPFNWRLDEFYGEELALIPMEIFPQQGSPDPVQFQFYRNGQAITPWLIGAAASINIAFNHPYAANGGGYLDRTLDCGGDFHAGAVQCIVGGGRMSSDYGAFLEARSSGEEGFVSIQATGVPEPPDPYVTGGQRATKRRFGASFAGQFSAAIDMTGQLGDATIVTHDLVISASTLPAIGDNITPMTTLGALSVQGAISANANFAVATDTQTVRRASAALLGVLEGSAVEQSLDAVYPVSTATRFDWFSSSSENASTNRRFYWANASNWTYVSAQIQADSFYNTADTRGLAQAYVNAGYTVIVPRSSNLGPGPAQVNLCHPDSPHQCTFPGPERGTAIIAISPTGLAHVVYAQNTALKGGGGTNDAETNPTRVLAIPEDFLERQFTTRAEAYNVDMGTGAVTYKPPPDITVGEGDYPYSLSFQRSYRSGQPYQRNLPDPGPKPIQPFQERFGDSGWTSNWMHEARVQNDGQHAFGNRSPREATDTIAAIRVVLALSADQGSDLATLQYQLGAIHTLAWWSEHLSYNGIQLIEGADNRSFFRLADGTFQGPPGDATKVIQLGARASFMRPHQAGTLWSYNSICGKTTNTDGSTSYFGPWNTGFTACTTMSPGVPPAGIKWMRFVRQTFPQGVIVSFDDVTLSNNLGRSITLTTVQNQPWTLQYTLRDDAATTRTVSFNLEESTGPGVLSVTGTDSATWVYNGTSNANWRVFAPSSASVAAVTFAFNEARGQVTSLTDGVGNVANYSISTGRIGAMTDPAGFATRTYYDRNAQPVRITNRLGYDTLTAYDALRRVKSMAQPEGNSEEYEYDARNHRTHTRRWDKTHATHTDTYADYVITTPQSDYDLCGIPHTETDARGATTTTTLLASRCLISSVSQPPVEDGTTTPTVPVTLYAPVTQYTWNSLGQRLTKTDPTSRRLRYTYNATTNYLLTAIAADGTLNLTTTFGRNAAGDITSITDPNSHIFTGEYDTSRRLTRYLGPGGTNAETRWTYNSDGEVSQIKQSDGGIDPNTWPTTTYRYLLTGRVQSISDPDGGLTQYSYDPVNRPRCTAVRMNPAVYSTIQPTTGAPLDACTLSTTNPALGADRITQMEYDGEGRVLRERRAFGTALAQIYATRTWTANGKLDTVKDANNNLSNLDYDGYDRLYGLYFPNTTIGSGTASTTDYEQYGYDANDNRTSLRVRSSETVNFTYDALNRETFKDIPGSTGIDVNTRYDLAGRRTFARYGTSLTPLATCNSSVNQGVDTCYDAAGRLQYENTFGRRLIYAYDADSNRTRVTYPDSVYVQYTYDALNRGDQVQLNGSATGNNLIADYTYDPLSRRTQLDRSATLVSSVPLGGRTTYGYTKASRLSSLALNLEGAAAPNDANWAFTYNVAGQALTRTLVAAYERSVPALNQAYVRDGLNRYTSVGGATFAYDARQNLSSDGARSFTYDLENRLLTATAPSPVSATLNYDPLGRLHAYSVGAATTEFLYDGDRLVAEYVGAAIVRRYAHGPGVDEPLIWYEGAGTTDPRWVIADRQGSIIATTNASGTATPYGYDPYGQPHAWAGTGGAMLSRFRYTGQIALPELALYDYKARVYDSVLGRFLQTDPVGYQDDFNLYAYVANDPLNRADPSGREGCWQCYMDRPSNTPEQAAAYGESVKNAVLDTLPITGEFRAGQAFGRDPSLVNGIIVAASIVDLGAVAKGLLRGAEGVARGGTYVLRDAEGGIMRSGRTNDLARRAGEHARSPATRDLTFEPVHRTDSYAEQRGLEQHLHDTHNPPMNQRNPVDPNNPRAGEYQRAAEDYLRRQREPQ